jgi:hypothetical protein
MKALEAIPQQKLQKQQWQHRWDDYIAAEGE